MTGTEASSIVLQLKIEREGLEPLNRTVTHCLYLASDHELPAAAPEGQHARRVPSTWGVRRDLFFWDSWDWKIRGEDDLRQFFAIARRIGGHLQGLENTEAANLLPGNVNEVVGRRTDLYLPDYWLFIVHHLGWTDQLPYGTRIRWKRGHTFAEEPFSMTSRLPVNVVQASIDALTVLIDAVPHRVWDQRAGGYVTRRPFISNDSHSEASAVALPAQVAPQQCSETASNHEQQHSETSHEAAEAGNGQNRTSKTARRRADRPHVKKRADRAANMESLKKELIEHIKAARDHAQAAVDFGGEPTLLPRPSRRELAARVGITESAASRCFSDPAATELNLLWNTADDLKSVMKFIRH